MAFNIPFRVPHTGFRDSEHELFERRPRLDEGTFGAVLYRNGEEVKMSRQRNPQRRPVIWPEAQRKGNARQARRDPKKHARTRPVRRRALLEQ